MKKLTCTQKDEYRIYIEGVQYPIGQLFSENFEDDALVACVNIIEELPIIIGLLRLYLQDASSITGHASAAKKKAMRQAAFTLLQKLNHLF